LNAGSGVHAVSLLPRPHCQRTLSATQKTNLSAELLFELTATAQKQAELSIDAPKFIHLSPKPLPAANAKLKTDDFFEEFDNNFVITFEEERSSPQEDLSKTAVFQPLDTNSLHHSKTTEVAEMEAERRRDTFGDLKILSLRTGMSLMQPNCTEERGSPVAFEVKKRTVFKAKENIIANNGQAFKLTKKKIFNQHIFEEFSGRTKSKAGPRFTAYSQKSLPSKAQLRQPQCPSSRGALELRPRTHPSILERQSRDSRSSTLNNWRKRFSREKKLIEGGSKRDNIFHLQSIC
jgi:hypothetical protein